jgi:hypothetical protein
METIQAPVTIKHQLQILILITEVPGTSNESGSGKGKAAITYLSQDTYHITSNGNVIIHWIGDPLSKIRACPEKEIVFSFDYSTTF